MSATESSLKSPPDWLADMEFCHIDDGSGLRALCNAQDADGQDTCAAYQDRAICPSCGKPTCPRCAQLSSLEDRLL